MKCYVTMLVSYQLNYLQLDKVGILKLINNDEFEFVLIPL